MKFDRDNNNKYGQCVPQQPVVLTPGFIKKWYEINSDTNAFTDADKYKLDNLTDGKDGLDGTDGKDGTDGVNGTDGTNGKDGKEGQQGLTGNEGPKGLQGDQGIPGTNTPAPGPTGPKGAKGDKGDRGTNGTDGIIGKDGVDGAGGLKGDKGDTGPVGIQGPQGVKGSTGSEGPRGPKGLDGTDGSQGNHGPTGATGSAGKDGSGVTIKGSDTKAHILAKTGTAGDMWLITDVGPDSGKGLVSDGNGSGIAHWTDVGSIRGPAGPKGAQGQPGVNGSNGSDSTVQGPTGPQGLPGDQGIQGIEGKPSTVPGPTGLQGVRGEKGDTGIDGPIGPIGHTGATGPQGSVGPIGPKGEPGSGTGLDTADKTKLDFLTVTKASDLDAIGAKVALIDGTTGINFDEIILDGDRASVSDIDDPNAVPTTLERFVSIAGLRHGLARFGKVMATTYEHLLGNPTKDGQILSSKKDGTRSWISMSQHLHGTTEPDDALGNDNDIYFKL